MEYHIIYLVFSLLTTYVHNYNRNTTYALRTIVWSVFIKIIKNMRFVFKHSLNALIWNVVEETNGIIFEQSIVFAVLARKYRCRLKNRSNI